MPDLANPLIVQSDRSLLLEVDNARASDCRDAIAPFAELVKSPEHIHTYRISPLSLWNARAAGVSIEEVTSRLATFAKYDLPGNVLVDIRDYASRYGRLKLTRGAAGLVLEADSAALAAQLRNQRKAEPLLAQQLDERHFSVDLLNRGRLKQTLIKIGFPVEDLAGYVEGEHLAVDLRDPSVAGQPFQLRDYQLEAAGAFWAAGSVSGGSGVLALPCGAGKTVIAMDVIARAKTSTLIMTTGITASN
ncbi:MAG: helicase-associated domain-containing protein, partial [Chloroflexota bacterium]